MLVQERRLIVRRNPLYGRQSVTSCKSAFVILKKCRSAFGRIPKRDSKGMSEKSTLFLDIDEFEIRGSIGEPMWDSPQDITADKNIRDWIGGLREDGGGGYVHHSDILRAMRLRLRLLQQYTETSQARGGSSRC